MPKPVTAPEPPLTMSTHADGHIDYAVQLSPDHVTHVASLFPRGTRYQLFGCGESRLVPSAAAAQIHILRKALTIAAESAASWKASSKQMTAALLDVVDQRDELMRRHGAPASPESRQESNQP